MAASASTLKAKRQQKPSALPPNRSARLKEPPTEQVASFVEFFVWLLVLKTFLVPLFIIPTGSMAETLCGAHATHTCPNCGREYEVGFGRAPDRPPEDPKSIECPNCRWREAYADDLRRTMQPTAGDRIVVHGWTYDLGMGPQNWDVIVFRPPHEPDTNFIKRLIGLPGQQVEIINGDIFIDNKIARKPRQVQESLWFQYFDNDHAPLQPSQSGYFPHWSALQPDSGWRDLATRVPLFDGLSKPRSGIRFLTRNGTPDPVCEVNDAYGYNWLEHRIEMPSEFRNANIPRMPNEMFFERVKSIPDELNPVTDIRLSCEARIEAGDGCIELSTTKYANRFIGRLYADGRVTLEHENRRNGERQLWGEQQRAALRGPVRVALSVVDCSVSLDLDGQPALQSTPGQYDVTPGQAKELSTQADDLDIQIAAERVKAAVAHIRVDRDVYYCSRSPMSSNQPRFGVQGNPIQLGKDEYFVLGDNSPESADARYWNLASPHLGPNYKMGTVPANQIIGRAFLVYWPGFLPLWPGGPNILPNIGQVRWIR